MPIFEIFFIFFKIRYTIHHDDNRIESDIDTDSCKNTDNEVNFIEQVEIVVSIRASNRGKLEINITAPSGTKSILLPV